MRGEREVFCREGEDEGVPEISPSSNVVFRSSAKWGALVKSAVWRLFDGCWFLSYNIDSAVKWNKENGRVKNFVRS